MENDKKSERVREGEKPALTLTKQTIRVISVRSHVRTGEIAACSSCPSRISTPSNTVMV